MRPTSADYTKSDTLTNLSVDYQNEAYVAEQILPVATVEKKNGIYFEYDKSKFRDVETLRAPGTRAGRVDYGLIERSYGPIVEHSLESRVTREEVDQSEDALTPFETAAETVMNNMMIRKERELATTMGTLGTWSASNRTTLSGTSQFSDYANSDPLGVVDTARDAIHAATIQEANTLLLSRSVYRKLRRHPQLQAQLGVNRNQVVTLQDMKDLFEVQNIIVAGGLYNTADQGASDSLDYIWGKHMWLLYVATTPQLKQVTLGFTLKFAGGIETDTRWESAIKSWWVRTADYREQKFVSVDCGYFIQNAIA